MSDARSAYLQYIETKGYPPKRADHLINFCKESSIKLSWKDATTILRNPPISSIPEENNPNPSYNNNNNNPNEQAWIGDFTRKRSTNNTSARHSSKSDATWNLKFKVDASTGQQYVSSQGIPPPPSNPDIIPLQSQNYSAKKNNQQQKRISSKGIPPPPGYTDIWANKNNNNNNNKQSHKIKVSSHGIPPPPGYSDLWLNKNNQKQLDIGRQAFTPSPRSINKSQTHSRVPTSPQLTSHYASHDSYKSKHSQQKSFTSPQLHNNTYIGYSTHAQSNSMTQFQYPDYNINNINNNNNNNNNNN
eukprot:219526_1